MIRTVRKMVHAVSETSEGREEVPERFVGACSMRGTPTERSLAVPQAGVGVLV